MDHSTTPVLPGGYALGHPTARDREQVAALLRAVETALRGESSATPEDADEIWALPRLDPGKDLWVVRDAASHVVAHGFIWVERPPDLVLTEIDVHPQHRGLGLSEALLTLAEARAAEHARRAPDGATVSLGTWAHEDDAGRLSLFTRHGFRHARTFLRLSRELTDDLAPPQWPEGIKVRTFRRGHDEAVVHAATYEAFADHFRADVMDLGEWLAFRFERADLDLGLYLVAWDGDEVAGSALAFMKHDGAYVDEVSVRRRWRGRGLARALLLQLFAELRRRGAPRVHLHVDSANPTGAMRLYGSVCMTAEPGAHPFFEKDVPAG